jgi:hypothetical protein
MEDVFELKFKKGDTVQWTETETDPEPYQVTAKITGVKIQYIIEDEYGNQVIRDQSILTKVNPTIGGKSKRTKTRRSKTRRSNRK